MRRALGDTGYTQLSIFHEVVSMIRDSYVDPVNMDRTLDAAESGLLEALDGDSGYLDADDFKTLQTGKRAAADTGIVLGRRFGFLTVVATRPDLGTLNHTALTLEAMAHRGVQLAGLVVGSWPADPDLAQRCNLRDLETLAARPLAGALPAGAGALTAPEFLLAARTGLSPAFGGIFDAATFRETHQKGAIP